MRKKLQTLLIQERQLILLLKFIESKDKAEGRITTPATIKKSADKVQYQRNIPRGNEDDTFSDETRMISRRRKRHTRSEKKRKLKLSKSNEVSLFDNRLKKKNFIDQNSNEFTSENPTISNSFQNDFPINASINCNHSWNQDYCSTTCRSKIYDNSLEKKFEDLKDNKDTEGSEGLTMKLDVTHSTVDNLNEKIRRIQNENENLLFAKQNNEKVDFPTGKVDSTETSLLTQRSAEILKKKINVYFMDND